MILNIAFYAMARRAKYTKYFVTRSPTGLRLAHIKIGIAVKNSNLNSIGEMAERLKARPC
ncbi:MAG: hypothetical protein DRQ44_11250 [Gammaproteobacteria bacterium]|nr:MAG: hypothetical protein DRQ44_11250 [Gammaproteobacteria bacterium]